MFAAEGDMVEAGSNMAHAHVRNVSISSAFSTVPRKMSGLTTEEQEWQWQWQRFPLGMDRFCLWRRG